MKINGKPDGGEGGAAVWGGITGNLSDQSDLINKFDDYATESWVQSQGYLTSVPSEYATQSWVESQGYLSSDDPSIEPLVRTTTVYAAKTAVWENIGQMLGLDYYDPNFRQYVFNIGGEIYFYASNKSTKIYKYNKEYYKFEYVADASFLTTNRGILWEDLYGNVYLLDSNASTAEQYKIDLTTGDMVSWYGLQNVPYGVYNTTNRVNLYKVGTDIFCADQATGLAYKYVFDDGIGEWYFDSSNPISYTNCKYNQIRYVSFLNGVNVTDNSGSLYQLEYHEGETTELTWVQQDTPIYPTLNDSLPAAQYVTQYGNTLIYMYLPNVYILTNGEWVNLNMDFSTITAAGTYTGNPCGVTLPDEELLMGWSYRTGSGAGEQVLMIMNLSDSAKTVNNILLDLSECATEEWVSSQGFATQSWVFSQNYANYGAVQTDLSRKANKTDIFLNEEITPYGSDFSSTEPGCAGAQFYNYWTTPSGRLFCRPIDDQDAVNEFINLNGYQVWMSRSMSVIPTTPAYQTFNTGTNLFYIDPNNSATYLWDDTNSDWTYICAGPTSPWSGSILITTDDTLRCDDGTKLTYNNGVWSWVASAMTDQFVLGLPLLVGSTVYVMDARTHDLYTYDESTTTYTSVASELPATGDCMFTVGGEYLFVTNYETVAKWDSDLQATVDTDIPHSWYNQPYFTYKKMLWTTTDEYGYNIGCLGSTTISKPEVPASNGTYVLKAVRTSSGVTYEWVVDEVTQAVQITNEILS